MAKKKAKAIPKKNNFSLNSQKLNQLVLNSKQLFFNWLVIFIPVEMASTAALIVGYLKPQIESKLNADVSRLEDFYIPFIAGTLAAALISLVYVIIFKKNKNLALLASLCMIFTTLNFDERFLSVLPVLKTIFPINTDRTLIYSCLLIVLLIITYAYVAKIIVKNADKYKIFRNQMYTLLLVASIYIFLVNFLPFSIYTIKTWKQNAYRPAELASKIPDGAKTADKPDIYYIVLDRYENGKVLKDQLGFDNSDFYNYLDSQGYKTNQNAFSTYPYTSMSIGSTMSATHLDDMEKKFGKDEHQTESAYFMLTQYSSVAKELKKIGYNYSVIGSWFGVSNKAPLADKLYYDYSSLHIGDKTYPLAQYDGSRIGNSIYTQFLTSGLFPWSYSYQDHAGLAKYDISTLNSLADQKAGGRFIFAHLLMPHDPYVFNGDGSLSIYDQQSNDNGRPLKQKYLEQVKYINSQMTSLVAKINANSGGKAVVVIQADEGYYPDIVLNDEPVPSDMSQWSDRYLHAKYGIMAAYHLPGVSDEELNKGANSTNIFRLILDHYFDYNLPMLPICQFGFNEGRQKNMNYTDLTARFTDSPDLRCKTIHD